MYLGESSSSFNSYQIPEEGKFSGSSKVRPKKILHFSDGIMEEYSSDEEGIHPVPQTAPLVDPKTLSWIPWIRHNASQALALFDYAGESIADFLGITSPKYSYEIDEAQRMKEDEEKEREARDIEMSGWIEPGKSSQMEFENANNQHLCPESNIPVIVCPPTEQNNSI